MIEVTQLNGTIYFINPHQIESMELVPDTVLTMLSGKRLMVRESSRTIMERIVAYRKQIGAFKNEE
jgi:flagellar protein FlbD